MFNCNNVKLFIFNKHFGFFVNSEILLPLPANNKTAVKDFKYLLSTL